MFERDRWDEVGAALDDVAAAQRAVEAGEVARLAAVLRFADANASRGVDAPEPARGGEQLVRLGGEGTPEVLEFSAAELGPVLGVSHLSAAAMVADALDLRHRLPQTWAMVQAGDVKA